MSNFAVYLEDNICDWLNGAAMPAAPASLTLALSTADPLDDLSGLAEVAGFGYARQAIAFGAITSTNGVGSQMSNTGAITFTAAGGAWGIISHYVIYTIGGDGCFHGAFAASKNIADGDSFVVNIGDITITIR